MQPVARLVPYAMPPIPRQDCGLGEYCTPVESSLGCLAEQCALLCTHKHVKVGQALYRLGERLGSIYPIKAGSFKVCTVTQRGDLAVMGFYMRGEIMGLDALATQRHACTATAIEDSEVCIIPFRNFESLCMKTRPLLQHFHRIMA